MSDSVEVVGWIDEDEIRVMQRWDDLHERVERGQLRATGAFLETDPPGGMPGWDRAEGMLLGLAIGDALGNTSEGMLPANRQRRYGEIRSYLPNRYANSRPVGLPSDDTQLAFWALEAMLKSGSFDPETTARRFADGRRIFGLGSSVREFLRKHRNAPDGDWLDWAAESAGNGALMRIAPILIPHLADATTDLWVDALLCGAMTHNDFASNGACVALVAVLWDALQMTELPAGDWWSHRFLEVARDVEGGDSRYRPRGGAWANADGGPCWQYTERVLAEARRAGWSTLDACNKWYSGAYLLETIPSVLYILEKHAHDAEEAIVRAVNDTKDNDTIAAIVGACVGALHGKAALPERWRDGLSGRTREADDGAVFRIIENAEAKFRPAFT